MCIFCCEYGVKQGGKLAVVKENTSCNYNPWRNTLLMFPNFMNFKTVTSGTRLKHCRKLSNVWQKSATFWRNFVNSNLKKDKHCRKGSSFSEKAEFGVVQTCMHIVLSSISRNILQDSAMSIYFQKLLFDTADNEPSKVGCKGLTPYNYNGWISYLHSRLKRGSTRGFTSSSSLSIRRTSKNPKKKGHLFSVDFIIHTY